MNHYSRSLQRLLTGSPGYSNDAANLPTGSGPFRTVQVDAAVRSYH
jgi:hypothetical protein